MDITLYKKWLFLTSDEWESPYPAGANSVVSVYFSRAILSRLNIHWYGVLVCVPSGADAKIGLNEQGFY